jgi:trehalose 6-phosphate phosphatase
MPNAICEEPSTIDSMPLETAEKLEAFFTAVRLAPQSILLLDYDGTMSPFRIDRFQARPYAGVRKLLARIQSLGRTRMAVITGRPAAEIAPMLALETPLEIWGLHGAERIAPDGHRQMDPASPAALARLEQIRAELARASFGGLIEDKPNAVVMHWRGASPQKARTIERKTRRLFEPVAAMDGLSLLEFEAGVELRVGRDKGGAVEAILAESKEASGRDAPVAYLGDDLTDEAAFRSIDAAPNPSLSVLMRRVPRSTAAGIWLRPPDGLRSFLAGWVSAQSETPIAKR